MIFAKNENGKLHFVRLFLLLIFLALLHPGVKAQKMSENSLKQRLGVYVASAADASLVYFTSMDGAGRHDYQNGLTTGLNYVRGINRWLDFETGLEYSTFRFWAHPGSHIPPGTAYAPRTERLNVFVLPLTLRVNFLNYFFANGGALLDIDLSGESSIDRQNGIGAVLGLGFQYDFRCGLSACINPCLRLHSLLSLPAGTRYPERLLHDGIRLGVAYRFE
ncbi:MAG: hypothetical protein LBH19_15725 [Dysgonamonadaceae bacterium]|nr:hypothetical protein [Dysgonamonadaceae bacterium]